MTTRIDTPLRRAEARRPRRRSSPSSWPAIPTTTTSLAILKALPKAGADIIELGMPFTDPMADGPAIQAAGLRALKAGQTMTKTLAMVRGFRKDDDDTPIVLMGYYNPIYIYGVDRFLADAKAAGVDGLIVVDLPPEEDDELCLPALKAGLELHPPGDADHRRQAAAGGAREHLGLCLLRLDHRHHRRALRRIPARSTAAVARIKRHTRLPVAVGFGVQDRGAGARDRRAAPTAWWSARRWSTRCATASTRTARRPPRPVKAVTDLVADAGARRAFRRRRRRRAE